tara:strand:+ start:791 stop:1642 length:852 start_codon:yes stop_codon:yes gene_type:complete
MNQQITTTKREPELPVGEVAKYFVQSGMFPDTKQLATAATKLIVGRGLGLSDYDCMGGLHIIQGKAVLASNAMSAAIKASGKYEYRVVEQTEEKCVIDFYMVNGGKLGDKIGSTTWTMEKAKRAGLNGQNWKKYPEAMLFARAISEGYRTHCPDALGCSAPVYVEAHGESEIPGKEADVIDTTATVIDEPLEKRKSKEVERETLQGRHIEKVEEASSGQYKWDFITIEGDDRRFSTFSKTMGKVARAAKVERVMCDVEVVLIEKTNGDQHWNLVQIEAMEGVS